jgi:hypothetical protein
MKTSNQISFVDTLLAFLLIFLTSGCGQIAGYSNFTLARGESTSGNLLVLSQNALLEQGSFVNGSVIMLCCNLTVDGEVSGDIFLLTGNVKIDMHADVNGDVKIGSGNLSY